MPQSTGTSKVVTGKASAKIERPPRADGYRPISDPLWVWAALGGGASPIEQLRLVLLAARRLDSGHSQLIRVREAITSAPPLGSPAGRQAAHDLWGEAEMGIWALDKALEIALGLCGRFQVKATVPAVLRDKAPLISRLRNHYAHMDERALGKLKGHHDPAAVAEAFQFDALVLERRFTDGHDSLDLDDETTDLCIETRNYLVATWIELVAQAEEPA